MNAYEELYAYIIEEHGIDPELKLKQMGYYLTVRDYIRAVSERGGADRLIPVIKSLDSKDSLLAYMKGASMRIIGEYLSRTPGYRKYYKDIIKKVG